MKPLDLVGLRAVLRDVSARSALGDFVCHAAIGWHEVDVVHRDVWVRSCEADGMGYASGGDAFANAPRAFRYNVVAACACWLTTIFPLWSACVVPRSVNRLVLLSFATLLGLDLSSGLCWRRGLRLWWRLLWWLWGWVVWHLWYVASSRVVCLVYGW